MSLKDTEQDRERSLWAIEDGFEAVCEAIRAAGETIAEAIRETARKGGAPARRAPRGRGRAGVIYHYVIMRDAKPAVFRWEAGAVDVLLFSSHERAFRMRSRFANAVGIGKLDSQVIPLEAAQTLGRGVDHYLLDLDPEDLDGLTLKEGAVLVRWPLTVESLEGVVT